MKKSASNLPKTKIDSDVQELIRYLRNDLESVSITCATIFGSCANPILYDDDFSDIDIVAYSSIFSREKSEEIRQFIISQGGDFQDKQPIYLEDFISPRIEFFYKINDTVFDINLFPLFIHGYEGMSTNVVHDSIDIVMGAMYQHAIPIFGEFPFAEKVESEFMPFYSDSLRAERMILLEARISVLLDRIVKKIENKDVDVLPIILKARAYLVKWIFINERKYPIDTKSYLGYQLHEWIGLHQERVDDLLLRGDNIRGIAKAFVSASKFCLSLKK